MNKLVLIVHNLRSAHNVGSLLRTADGLGISKIYLTGYTAHPPCPNDARMPHEAAKAARQIHKTALGAEATTEWQYCSDINVVTRKLKTEGFSICALEQANNAVNLQDYKPGGSVGLIVGNEVVGIDSSILDSADTILEIPMQGAKESFNVAQAAAMALYSLKHKI